MPFEVWDYKETEATIPSIRLSKSSIVINKVLKQALTSNKLQLAYDRKAKIIQIKCLQPDQPGIELQHTKILAKGFFERFNIKVDEPKRYEATWDAKEQAWLIKI